MTPSERQKWLDERRTGIGGSDVAAILGISPWETPLNVWLEKTGRALPKPENEAMRIGTELEDFVARRYCQETGRQVQRFNRMIHDGCLLGNFDRLIVPDGEKTASYKGELRTNAILECKTASIDWDGEVPIHYITQVQHYLGLDPKLERADVAVLFLIHKRFETYTVYRDDEVIKAMRERLTAWWEEYVVGDKMPPAINEDDCKLMWARSNPGKTIAATPQILETVDSLKAAIAEADAKKAEVDRLKSDIRLFMQDAEVLTDAAGTKLLSWKSGKYTSTTDWQSLALALNATETQIAQYTTTSPGARRFLLAKPKMAKVA